MPMKISKLISELQRAQEAHGDLPVYTEDSDIHRVEIAPTIEGAQVVVNGVGAQNPEEVTLIFHPAPGGCSCPECAPQY